VDLQTLDKANKLRAQKNVLELTLKYVNRMLEFTEPSRIEESVDCFELTIRRKHVDNLEIDVDVEFAISAITKARDKLNKSIQKIDEEFASLGK